MFENKGFVFGMLKNHCDVFYHFLPHINLKSKNAFEKLSGELFTFGGV